MTGVTPGYAFREGQWINFEKAGRRYLHQLAAQTITSAGGTATLVLTLPTRVSLGIGDAVIVGRPTIEGDLVELPEFTSDVASWLATPRFTIAEDE